MLGMSEGSKQERLKEITDSNTEVENAPLLTFGGQFGAIREHSKLAAPGGEDQELNEQLTEQLKRFEQLSGEERDPILGFGYAGTGSFNDLDKKLQYYQSVQDKVRNLKEAGHDIKTLEEVGEGVSTTRKNAQQLAERVNDVASRRNRYKNLGANIAGEVAGLASTPEGLALTIAQGVGGEAAFAVKSTVKAIGSIAAFEGVLNRFLGRDRAKEEANIAGRIPTEREIDLAGRQQGAVGAAIGTVAIGGTRAAKSGFTKLNAFRSDIEAAEALNDVINRVNKVKEEKGAVAPEVESVRQQAEDLQTAYVNKPEDMTVEEYNTHMANSIDRLDETPANEFTAPEGMEQVHARNVDEFTPDELTEHAEIRELVDQEDIDLTRETDIEGETEDLGAIFKSEDGYKTEMDELITCMAGGVE